MAGKDKVNAQWKVHTPNLLTEVLSNSGTSILHIPLNILARLLEAVAVRASQLNDQELNQLMVRLTLYDIADPESKGYDKNRVDMILKGDK